MEWRGGRAWCDLVVAVTGVKTMMDVLQKQMWAPERWLASSRITKYLKCDEIGQFDKVRVSRASPHCIKGETHGVESQRRVFHSTVVSAGVLLRRWGRAETV